MDFELPVSSSLEKRWNEHHHEQMTAPPLLPLRDKGERSLVLQTEDTCSAEHNLYHSNSPVPSTKPSLSKAVESLNKSRPSGKNSVFLLNSPPVQVKHSIRDSPPTKPMHCISEMLQRSKKMAMTMKMNWNMKEQRYWQICPQLDPCASPVKCQ